MRELSKQQHTKIEEIKKKTNYYQMREMMAKYDETSGGPAPTSPAPRKPQQPVPQQPMPATPQRRPIPQQVQQRPIQGSPNPMLLQTPMRPGLQSQLMRGSFFGSGSNSRLTRSKHPRHSRFHPRVSNGTTSLQMQFSATMRPQQPHATR